MTSWCINVSQLQKIFVKKFHQFTAPCFDDTRPVLNYYKVNAMKLLQINVNSVSHQNKSQLFSVLIEHITVRLSSQVFKMVDH